MEHSPRDCLYNPDWDSAKLENAYGILDVTVWEVMKNLHRILSSKRQIRNRRNLRKREFSG
jgi:hypothetical protein